MMSDGWTNKAFVLRRNADKILRILGNEREGHGERDMTAKRLRRAVVRCSRMRM